jgi:hypothetical protein
MDVGVPIINSICACTYYNKLCIDQSPNKQMYMDTKMDAKSEIFQTEEQENDNIIITSHIQPTDNTYEDEQVCIYDYLAQLEKFLWMLSKNTHVIVEL